MAFIKFYTFVCQRAVILQGERIQGKPKKSRQLFFHEESIHEVSRRYLNAQYIQLLPNNFLDSDICHNYLHTPVILNWLPYS